MKVSLVVKDRDEADAVKRAMDDPVTRVVVVMMGHLLALPSDRARQRVLGWVKDKLDDEGSKSCPPAK